MGRACEWKGEALEMGGGGGKGVGVGEVYIYIYIYIYIYKEFCYFVVFCSCRNDDQK